MGKILSPSGRQENAFSRRQMGLVQEDNLVVFNICLPRDAVRQRTKKLKTQEDRVLSQPWGNREHSRKDSEQAPSSGPKVREQTDVKCSKSREASPATRDKILCLWAAECKISSCGYRHPPVCHSYKSGNECIYGHRCQYRHADGEEKPNKRWKKESTQGAVAILRQNKVQGCGSQNSDPKKPFRRKAGAVRLNASAGHTIKF